MPQILPGASSCVLMGTSGQAWLVFVFFKTESFFLMSKKQISANQVGINLEMISNLKAKQNMKVQFYKQILRLNEFINQIRKIFKGQTFKNIPVFHYNLLSSFIYLMGIYDHPKS